MKSYIRLALTLAAFENIVLWSRDITLAFLQSKDELKREVHIRTPKGENILQRIGAPKSSILKAVKPQYGLVEYPGYRSPAFKYRHVSGLGMRFSILHPRLFYKTKH